MNGRIVLKYEVPIGCDRSVPAGIVRQVAFQHGQVWAWIEISCDPEITDTMCLRAEVTGMTFYHDLEWVGTAVSDPFVAHVYCGRD